MNTQMQPMMSANSSLSEPMQRRLQTRIAQHHGNVDAVIEDIRAELAQIDADPDAHADENRQRHQSQRALLVAQIDYLSHLGNQPTQELRRSHRFWSRFRRVQRGAAAE